MFPTSFSSVVRAAVSPPYFIKSPYQMESGEMKRANGLVPSSSLFRRIALAKCVLIKARALFLKTILTLASCGGDPFTPLAQWFSF